MHSLGISLCRLNLMGTILHGVAWFPMPLNGDDFTIFELKIRIHQQYGIPVAQQRFYLRPVQKQHLRDENVMVPIADDATMGDLDLLNDDLGWIEMRIALPPDENDGSLTTGHSAR